MDYLPHALNILLIGALFFFTLHKINKILDEMKSEFSFFKDNINSDRKADMKDFFKKIRANKKANK